jgi:hypothetical protein
MVRIIQITAVALAVSVSALSGGASAHFGGFGGFGGHGLGDFGDRGLGGRVERLGLGGRDFRDVRHDDRRLDRGFDRRFGDRRDFR